MQFTADSRFVSRETQERLRAFAELVLKWQKSINLIAPTTVPDIWERHVLDSLRVFELDPFPKTWADLGSGAGFPGLVTAICLREPGAGWVHLIESNQKKAAFLRSAILETEARASVHPVRIEDAGEVIPVPDAVSARALTSLPQLLNYVAGWARQKPEMTCWFHKGFGYRDEVELARGQWSFDLLEHASRVREGSVVLQIQNLRKTI